VSSSEERLAELETLYRSRWAAFARVAVSVSGSAELGKEAVQEGFARAIEQRDQFRGDCPLDAWVWRIIVNRARTSGERAFREVNEVAPQSGKAIGNGHRPLSGLELWVQALPERQRLVVFLRYWADLDYRAIAEILEVEVGTVSATLSAALKTLRHSLQEVQ
jgi:RNA polymerase sigma-70 factor (ECF subfamily)